MISENRTGMRIANGKIVEQWLAWDTPDMMQQPGAIPSQVSPTPPPRLHTEAVREGGSEPIGTDHIYVGASERRPTTWGTGMAPTSRGALAQAALAALRLARL